jgi:hypothetical protein
MKTFLLVLGCVVVCATAGPAWAQQQPPPVVLSPVPASLGGGPGYGMPPPAPIINQGIHPGPVSSGIHPR